MKKIVFLFAIILLASCSGQDAKYVCSCEQREKIQQFIGHSIKPANNMSDEEMEDVIRELFRTGVKLNCDTRVFPTDEHNRIDWGKAKIDSCEVAYNWIY